MFAMAFSVLFAQLQKFEPCVEVCAAVFVFAPCHAGGDDRAFDGFDRALAEFNSQRQSLVCGDGDLADHQRATGRVKSPR